MSNPQTPTITRTSNDPEYEIEYVIDSNGYVRRDEAGQLMIYHRSRDFAQSRTHSGHVDIETAASDQATDGDSPRRPSRNLSWDNTVLREGVSVSEPATATESAIQPPSSSSLPFSYQDAEQKARHDSFVAKVQLAIFAYNVRRDAPKVPHDPQRAIDDDRPSPSLQATIPPETLSDLDDLNARLDDEDYDPEQIEAYLQQIELDRVLAESAEVSGDQSHNAERLSQAIARGKAEGEVEFNRRMKELVDRHLPPHMRVAPPAPDLRRGTELYNRGHAGETPEQEPDLEAEEERNVRRAVRHSRRMVSNSDGYEVDSESTDDEEREERTLQRVLERSAESHRRYPGDDDDDPRGSLQTTLRESARMQSDEVPHGGSIQDTTSEPDQLPDHAASESSMPGPSFLADVDDLMAEDSTRMLEDERQRLLAELDDLDRESRQDQQGSPLSPDEESMSELPDVDDLMADSTRHLLDERRRLLDQLDEIDRESSQEQQGFPLFPNEEPMSIRLQRNETGEIQSGEQPGSETSSDLDELSELELGLTESSSEESENNPDGRGDFQPATEGTRGLFSGTLLPLRYIYEVEGEQFQATNTRTPMAPPTPIIPLYMVTLEMPQDFDQNPDAAHALAQFRRFLGAERLTIYRPAPPPPILPRRLDPAERNQIDDDSITTPRSLALIDAMIYVLHEHRYGRRPVQPSIVQQLYGRLSSVQECIRWTYWLRGHGYDTEVILRPQEHAVHLHLRTEDGRRYIRSVGFSQAASSRPEVREFNEAPSQAAASRLLTDHTRAETTPSDAVRASFPRLGSRQIEAMISETHELRAGFLERIDSIIGQLDEMLGD
ncbi:MAG: hypothetical protein M1812_003811 [Candelaria pacifica]|nr:MAG: hypothetical protein M1812_003811 [Candelaria pacifica]